MISETGWGTLFGIGVGPGDPELMTLRAVRLLHQSSVIAVPVTQADGESYALEVVAGELRPEHIVLRLHFPMVRDATTRIAHRQAAAQAIVEHLRVGQDVAFLTEGDPLLHSTFIYMLNWMPAQVRVEVVPGVSSVTAAAAQACVPLVNSDQRLAILPATYENVTCLRHMLHEFDTVVLLKVNRVLGELTALLDQMGLGDQAILVERATHPASRVLRGTEQIRSATAHYLSLLIIHTGRQGHAD